MKRADIDSYSFEKIHDVRLISV